VLSLLAKKRTPKKPQPARPWTQIAVAPSWPALGVLIASRDDDPKLDGIVKELRDKELHPDYREYVTRDTLRVFANMAWSLIKLKARGKPVATFIREHQLLLGLDDFKFKDNGNYFELVQTPRAFWADEYKNLVECFSKPTAPPFDVDWNDFIGKCKREGCPEIFVRQRSDQEYHDSSCRYTDAKRRHPGKRKKGGPR